jgi:alpha-tubulin suppressor-like RCC1 family protein
LLIPLFLIQNSTVFADQALQLGNNHSIYLDEHGTVWSWGNSSHLPSMITEIQGATAISTHGTYNSALLNNDIVMIWESGKTIDKLNHSHFSHGAIQQISTGGTYSLFLDNQGTVYQWSNSDPSDLNVVDGLPKTIKDISSGQRHFLALDTEGAVWSWGSNQCGELGRVAASFSSPAKIDVLSDIEKIFSAYDHNIVIKSTGQMLGWGGNEYGSLGVVSSSSNKCLFSPTKIPIDTPIIDISIGAHHVLAIDQEQRAWSWGSNFSSQLGSSDFGDGFPPHRIESLDSIVGVFAGQQHSAAQGADGTIWTWGANYNGELGLDSSQYTVVALPEKIDGHWGGVDISGSSHHKVFVGRDGKVYIRGSNHSGLFGISSLTLAYSDMVTVVNGVDSVSKVDTSNHHILAIDLQGRVWSWGENRVGQLGNGSEVDTIKPQTIDHFALPIKEVSVGAFHSLALDEDGFVWSWGSNRDGQLGRSPDSFPHSSTPIRLEQLPKISAIATGGHHSIALDLDGQVWSWGANRDSQLGREVSASNGDSWAPSPVPGYHNITLISATGDKSYLYSDTNQLIRFGRAPATASNEQSNKPSNIQSLSVPTNSDAVSNLTSNQNNNLLLISSGELGDEFESPLDAAESLGLDFIGGIWSGDQDFGKLVGARRELFLPNTVRHKVTRNYRINRGWNLINTNFSDPTVVSQANSQLPSLILNQSSEETPSAGYWVYSTTAYEFSVSGISEPLDHATIQAGWNQIALPDGLSLSDISTSISTQTTYNCKQILFYSAQYGWSVYHTQHDIHPSERDSGLLRDLTSAAWAYVE